MQIEKLLPAGSVVLLKNAAKKLVIIGILQVNPDENRIYDYLGVPYPEGYIGGENNFLFNHEDINDIIFRGYENPERESLVSAIGMIYEAAQENEGEMVNNNEQV